VADIPEDRAAPQAKPHEFEFPAVTGMPDGIGETFDEEELPGEAPIDVGADPEADISMELRRILGRFATGVTIVTTRVGDQVHGMTANAFMSVSLQPPLVLVSVDKRARMHGLLHVGKTYGVSVLGAHQDRLSDLFAGRAGDKPGDATFALVRETPLLEEAIVHVVARVVRTYWGGDHALFLGQVEYARYGEGRPLLFHGGQYEELRVASAPVFSGLSEATRAFVLERGTKQRFVAGEAVVREGEPGDVLYVILDGVGHVMRGGRMVKPLGVGDFFGEVSVFDGRPRTADVMAETDLDCLVISRDAVREVIESHPDVAWEMLAAMAGAIRGD
jgi:flavin reductase (DIM6/NTAB) family NADH-FMN oxidoreductase RutF